MKKLQALCKSYHNWAIQCPAEGKDRILVLLECLPSIHDKVQQFYMLGFIQSWLWRQGWNMLELNKDLDELRAAQDKEAQEILKEI